MDNKIVLQIVVGCVGCILFALSFSTARGQNKAQIERLRDAIASPPTFDWALHELVSDRKQKQVLLNKICAPYITMSEDTLLTMLHTSGSVTLALGVQSDEEIAQMMLEQLHLADLDGDLQNELIYDGDNPLKPGSLFILYKIIGDTAIQEIFFTDGLLKQTTSDANSATLQFISSIEKGQCAPLYHFQTVTFQSGNWKPRSATMVHAYLLEDYTLDKNQKLEPMKVIKEGCKFYDVTGNRTLYAYTNNGAKFKICPNKNLILSKNVWSLGQCTNAGGLNYRLCLIPAAAIDVKKDDDESTRPGFELSWIDETCLQPTTE